MTNVLKGINKIQHSKKPIQNNFIVLFCTLPVTLDRNVK